MISIVWENLLYRFKNPVCEIKGFVLVAIYHHCSRSLCPRREGREQQRKQHRRSCKKDSNGSFCLHDDDVGRFGFLKRLRCGVYRCAIDECWKEKESSITPNYCKYT